MAKLEDSNSELKKRKRKIFIKKGVAWVLIIGTLGGGLSGVAVSVYNNYAESGKSDRSAKYGKEVLDTLLKTLAKDFEYEFTVESISEVKKHKHGDDCYTGEEHVENTGHWDGDKLYYGANHSSDETEYDGKLPIEYKIEESDTKQSIAKYASKGVNTDGIKLEYIDSEDKKFVSYVDVSGTQFVNDGLLYMDDKYKDTGDGFSRSDYARGIWYNIIGTAISYGFNVDREGNSSNCTYTITSDDTMSIMDIFGYSMYYDEVKRDIKIELKVTDGLISGASFDLNIEREYTKENHKQTLTIKDISKEFKMSDYNLVLDTDNTPKYIDSSLIVTERPLQIGGVPYRASDTRLITNNGILMVASSLDDEIVESISKDIRIYNDTLNYAYIDFNDSEKLIILFEKDTNNIVGYKYYGVSLMSNFNYTLPYEFIDKYRIAPGFTGNNQGHDLLEYKGRIGNKPYTIAIQLEEEYPKSVEIMPDEYYKSIEALVVNEYGVIAPTNTTDEDSEDTSNSEVDESGGHYHEDGTYHSNDEEEESGN